MKYKDIDGWFEENCTYCGTKNHIYTDIHNAHAWECYFCGERHWINGLGREQYAISEGITEDEADEHLNRFENNIKFLIGDYKRS